MRGSTPKMEEMVPDTTRILLTCLSYADNETKTEKLSSVTGEQWQAVAALAGKFNIAPLLLHNLKLLGIALPTGLAQPMTQRYRQDITRNMRLYHQLAKLLRMLHEGGFPVIALKGAYLAETIYANIGLRTMGDVDLLVKQGDLQRIEELLLASGAIPDELNRTIDRENHHFGYRLPPGGLRLELHWQIVNPKYPFNIDLDGLWERSQPVTLAQAPARTLCPEDLLLHLCLHMARHTLEMHIRMLCDIGEVLRHFKGDLNWQEIGSRARQWGALRSTYLVLRLARELLDVDISEEQLASLLPEHFQEEYFRMARIRILSGEANIKAKVEGNTVRLWGGQGLGRKLALIGERLFPSRKAMARRYPASADSWRIYLYYPVRFVHILRTHGPTLWRLASGDQKTTDFAEQTNADLTLEDWLMSG